MGHKLCFGESKVIFKAVKVVFTVSHLAKAQFEHGFSERYYTSPSLHPHSLCMLRAAEAREMGAAQASKALRHTEVQTKQQGCVPHTLTPCSMCLSCVRSTLCRILLHWRTEAASRDDSHARPCRAPFSIKYCCTRDSAH